MFRLQTRERVSEEKDGSMDTENTAVFALARPLASRPPSFDTGTPNSARGLRIHPLPPLDRPFQMVFPGLDYLWQYMFFLIDNCLWHSSDAIRIAP